MFVLCRCPNIVDLVFVTIGSLPEKRRGARRWVGHARIQLNPTLVSKVYSQDA